MAAGKGERLQQVSKGLPKSLLTLGESTIIERGIAALCEAGADDIVVVTGYKSEEIVSKLKASPGCRFIFNPFFEKMNVLSSFWLAMLSIQDEDVIFLHADTVFAEPVMNRMLGTPGDVVLPIDFHPCGEEEMKVQVVERQVRGITKTMDPADAHGEFLGVALLRRPAVPRLRRAAEILLAAGRSDEYFEAALQHEMSTVGMNVLAVDVSDLAWVEIDFPEDYEKAKTLFGN